MPAERSTPSWFLLETASGLALALDIALVGRLEPVAQVVPVPGAPPGIVGLAEVRGRPVTLLDPAVCAPLAAASGEAPDPPRGALRLARPWEHLAFARAASTRVRPLAPHEELPGGAAAVDGACLERALAGLVPTRVRG
jgi:hypothetical protein